MAECARVEPLLSARLDGELGRTERAMVERHIQRCAGCAADASELAHVRALVRNLPVRRLPDGVALVDRGTPAAAAAPPRRAARAVSTLAVVGGLLTGAAYALGGQPAPAERIVNVPMDVYVADHFVHTVNRATFIPVGIGVEP